MDLRYIISICRTRSQRFSLQRDRASSEARGGGAGGGREKSARLIINIVARVGVDWRHQQSQIIEMNDGAPWSSANYRIHIAVTT